MSTMDTSAETDWRTTSLVRKIHALNARILAVFIVAHLFNHLNFTVGVEEHIAVMDKMRAVYRLPWLEYGLYGLFIVQIIAGLMLARKNWRPSSRWAWAQVISGLVIAFFLVQHLGATIYVRSAVPYIDTDAYWALAVVSKVPFSLYFAPYYFAGVTAVFVHIASAFHFNQSAMINRLAIPTAVLGVLVAATIVGSMLWNANLAELPAEYQRYLSEMYAS